MVDKKIHYMAAQWFTACKKYVALSKGKVETTEDKEKVTCLRCKDAINKHGVK